jgi:zinc/manganese transport system substrate-binding protein
MNKISFILILVSCLLNFKAQAKLSVVTTLTDLASIASEVGGGDVSVEAIAKGTQDPHFIEAKPSFAIRVSHANLLVSIGLGLEMGWLPSIIQLSRNPEITAGGRGYLEVGPSLDVIEIPSGKVTRSEGDVHPEGNPHVWLDPIRAGKIAEVLAQRMGELDPLHGPAFVKRAKAFSKRLADKTQEWKARIDKSGVKRIVTYHKTLNYFLDRFAIRSAAVLEPKPGIPPTSKHIMSVIEIIRREKVPVVFVENFYDPTVTHRISEAIPSIRISSVAVSVGGEPQIKTVDDLFEALVKALESK